MRRAAFNASTKSACDTEKIDVHTLNRFFAVRCLLRAMLAAQPENQ